MYSGKQPIKSDMLKPHCGADYRQEEEKSMKKGNPEERDNVGRIKDEQWNSSVVHDIWTYRCEHHLHS